MKNQKSVIESEFNIKKELQKDISYSRGNILSSMNSEPDPIARNSFIEHLTSNLGDPALFPGSTNIERYVVKTLGSLFNLPPEGTGVILSGGSEANVTAMWAIRNKHLLQLKATNNKTLEIIAPNSVHPSIDKAANLLSLKLVKVPTTELYQIDIQAAEKAINKNTIALIGIAGTTAYGTIDPLKSLNELCLVNNLELHVDAAFGGLIFPFLPGGSKKYDLLFDLESLASITVDIHKMGRVPIPGGGLLWRNKEYTDGITFPLPYLVNSPKQHTITGTRSGASAIAFAKLWQKIGFTGFQKLVSSCMTNIDFLYKELIAREFKIPIKPVINILGFQPSEIHPLTSNNLHKKLWSNGWITSFIENVIRVVIMPPTTKAHLKSFLTLLDSISN